MQTYKYSARNKINNEVVKDVVVATNERDARKVLIEGGLSVISIDKAADELIPKDKVSTKEKIVFTRQLAALINAGLPTGQALRSIGDQLSSPAMKNIVKAILIDIEGGRSLSQAMSRWPKVFNKIYLSIVAAGEVSGTLDKSLLRLADQQDKDAEILAKVKGALIYPAIVVLVIIGVVLFLLFTVMPQVEQLYKDLKEELPPVTQVIVGLTAFLVNYWWLVLAVLVLGIYFFMSFVRTERGKMFWDGLRLKIPVLKSLLIKLYMVRFCRTMEILLMSGVHMLEAVEISASSIGNMAVEKEIMTGQRLVKSGKALSEALAQKEGNGYIPSFVPQMVAIGEKSGKIDEMLGKTSAYYENEVDVSIRALQQMIEPLLMMMLALVAGVMILAVLLPVYNLSSRTSL